MKHIHRFFVSEPLAAGQTVSLGKDDSFRAFQVLRLRVGDRVELAGEDGRVFAAEVAAVDGRVEARSLREIEGAASAAPVGLVVVQALPKGRKLDLAVEKLSEVGVDRLVPVYSARTLVRPAANAGEKLRRWRRIARAAAAQSKRTRVMDIDDPLRLIDWLETFTGAVVVLSTEEKGMPLGEVVAKVNPPLALVIGPEAGFTDEEIEIFRSKRTCFASLGRRLLRAETAALVGATIVLHRLGGLG